MQATNPPHPHRTVLPCDVMQATTLIRLSAADRWQGADQHQLGAMGAAVEVRKSVPEGVQYVWGGRRAVPHPHIQLTFSPRGLMLDAVFICY
jgi:hypothetical protein